MSIKILIKIINLISIRLNRKNKVKKNSEDSLVLKNKVLNDLKQIIITIVEGHYGIAHKKKSEISLKNISEDQLRLILIGLKFLNEPYDSPAKVRLKKIISLIKKIKLRNLYLFWASFISLSFLFLLGCLSIGTSTEKFFAPCFIAIIIGTIGGLVTFIGSKLVVPIKLFFNKVKPWLKTLDLQKEIDKIEYELQMRNSEQGDSTIEKSVLSSQSQTSNSVQA